MPATAPKMITTPMAISQDIRAKTTLIGPHFLSSEMPPQGWSVRQAMISQLHRSAAGSRISVGRHLEDLDADAAHDGGGVA